MPMHTVGMVEKGLDRKQVECMAAKINHQSPTMPKTKEKKLLAFGLLWGVFSSTMIVQVEFNKNKHLQREHLQ